MSAPAQSALEKIIREECLPQQDCMLTVQDTGGEAGFLYFKGGELIEANFAALWGKEAVSHLVTWEIAEHTVTPLPLGIKRSLWDPLDALLNPDIDPSTVDPVKPVFQASKKNEAPTPWDDYKDLPGVTKIVHFVKGKGETVFESEGDMSHSTDYLDELITRAAALGDSLGMGKLQRWTLSTDRYQVVGMRHQGDLIAVLRKHDTGADDFEAALSSLSS